MKILYIEDDAALRRWTSDQLREYGYIVCDFFRIDQVKEYFNEHMEDIDLIITDLNMDDHWLGEYINESNGGYFAGWVWLEKFVYTKNPNFPTIIYSAYVDYLCEQKTNELKTMENIICVNKGVSDEAGFDKLIKAIKSISNIKNTDI